MSDLCGVFSRYIGADHQKSSLPARIFNIVFKNSSYRSGSGGARVEWRIGKQKGVGSSPTTVPTFFFSRKIRRKIPVLRRKWIPAQGRMSLRHPVQAPEKHHTFGNYSHYHRSVTKETVVPAGILKLRSRQKIWVGGRVWIWSRQAQAVGPFSPQRAGHDPVPVYCSKV